MNVESKDSSKGVTMSIRVSSDELATIKQASEIEKYSSYSEFVRRTVLLEACRIVEQAKSKGGNAH